MTGKTCLSQLKILYVEDDRDTREDLKQYLKKKAGKVTTAEDGEEGLRRYREEAPDIVIADILLPRMNGIEMLRKIREEGGKAPFIITSSVDEANTIIEAVDTGIVKYAVKPIILSRLLETLNRLAQDISSKAAVFNDVEKKLELESRIKQQMTAFLKKTTGKGPRDLTVFISSDTIAISAYGMLTPLEKKLLEDRHNVSMVEHIHKSYYKVVKLELEGLLADIVGREVRMMESDFSPLKAVDSLAFCITC